MTGDLSAFQGDFHGKWCLLEKKSSDVYNDYIDLLNGVVCDPIKWRLNHLAIYVEYEWWELHMTDNFARCHTYEYLEDSSCAVLGL
jgi:hypothetical protein